MCELFATSSKYPTRVTFSLDEFCRHGSAEGAYRDGWGLAFYEDGDAQLFREVGPAATSEWMDFLRHHQHRSRYVISHIRKATQGERALRNTQPFSRELHGYRHVFCHNGNLVDISRKIGPLADEPMGETDSEYAFCYLIGEVENLWRAGKPDLGQRAALVHGIFARLAELGPANFLYCDGEYLYAFANRRIQASGRVEPPGMYYLCRDCDCDGEMQPLAGLELTDVEAHPRQSIVLFASVPLSTEEWVPLGVNQLIVAAAGRILEVPADFPPG